MTSNPARWGIAGVLAALATAGLAACGSDGGGGGTTGAAAASPGKGKTVSLVVGSEGDDFYKAIECGAKIKSKELGVKLKLQGPAQFDPALQVPIVNGIAARRPDAIVIAPTDDTALYPPLKAATAAGSKLVLVDTTLKDASIAAGHIGSDYVLYGVQGAQQLTKLIGGKGTVLGIFAPPGVSTNDQGRKGFAAELKKSPGIKLLPFEFSSGAPGKSAAIVSAVLAAHPELAGVFTYNGGDAQGVVTALRQGNAADKVTFVSGDAQPYQVEQLKAGKVKALVVQQARRMGEQSIQYAVDAIAGKSVPKETAIKTVVADTGNLTQPAVADNLYKGC